MLIEFKCVLCGRKTTTTAENYKKGFRICESCTPDNQKVSVRIPNHIRLCGECLWKLFTYL
mgnify:CR=1 FL=1